MTIPAVTADEMREMDRATIEDIGVPGVVLMERAGLGVFQRIVEYAARSAGQGQGEDLGLDTTSSREGAVWSLVANLRVAVLCGAGNNGGDGYVVARHLHLAGARVTVFLLAAEDRIRGDARVNYDVARRLSIPCEPVLDDEAAAALAPRLTEQDCLVDALLGTGLSSDVRGRYRTVIDAMNASGAWTVAVDLPSGLAADTGQPLGLAVRADATVTFGCPKLGLVGHPGVEWCGDLTVVDIGIPRAVVAQVGPMCHVLEESDVAPSLPRRPAGGHKGTFGHVLCVAGSVGKSGAAVLAARGAARVGAGLVTVAAPEGALPAIMAHSVETMGASYRVDEGSPLGAVERLSELARGKSAILVGPGIPTGPTMLEVLRDFLADRTVPVVLDADALNLLARAPQYLQEASAPVVITPHPGEMARLLGSDVRSVQADRVATAREAAARFGVQVVLKGARTVIASPAGEAFVNPTGNPGMGSGGMGDVLGGILAGLLAQGADVEPAIRMGVYLHGLAGDRAAVRLGQHGLLAGDLLAEVPAVLAGWDRLRA